MWNEGTECETCVFYAHTWCCFSYGERALDTLDWWEIGINNLLVKTSLITRTNTGWKSVVALSLFDISPAILKLCCCEKNQRIFKQHGLAWRFSTNGFLLTAHFFRFQPLPPIQDFSFFRTAKRQIKEVERVCVSFFIIMSRVEFTF